MKALTIIQPFAELIANGEKRVENRDWPTNYRGPVAIHAGKAKKYDGDSVYELAQKYGIDPCDLAFGAVIATAEIIECIHIAKASTLPSTHPLAWVDQHEHSWGEWCWVLANVRRLPAPIPCRGSLGLWEWNGEDSK